MEQKTWLVTLPQRYINNELHPVTYVLIQCEAQDRYSDGFYKNGGLALTAKNCTLHLTWRDKDGHPQKQDYAANYRPELMDNAAQVALVNEDFVLSRELQGFGLGSWIMQHLVGWAKTLPPETPVQVINTSSEDEKETINHARRDRFWFNVGFRFVKGGSRAQPLCVRDLTLKEEYHLVAGQPVASQSQALTALLEERDQLASQVEEMKGRMQRQAEWIKYLSEHHWKTVWVKPFFRVLYSPLYLIDWVYHRATERSSTAHRMQDKDNHE